MKSTALVWRVYLLVAAPLLATSGCSLLFLAPSEPGAGDGGAGDDADGSKPCAPLPNLPSIRDCDLPEPRSEVSVTGELEFNSDTRTFSQTMEPFGEALVDQSDSFGVAPSQVAVVAFEELTIRDGGRLTVTGSVPVLLYVDGLLDIRGELSAASTDSIGGAGSNDDACPDGAALAGQGESGAAGGSFGAGSGSGGSVGADQPGAAGLPSPFDPLLRGGCAGGRAGNLAGGSGGGAIAMVSRSSIVIRASGNVDAGGSGGLGGSIGAPGPGGGSGGLIWLAAPEIEVLGTLSSGGGGGGGGGSDVVSAENGTTGSRIHEPTNFSRGGGGGIDPLNDGGQGGDGGRSATEMAREGGPAEPGAGGGGGGGSQGRIVILTSDDVDLSGTIEPAAATSLP